MENGFCADAIVSVCGILYGYPGMEYAGWLRSAFPPSAYLSEFPAAAQTWMPASTRFSTIFRSNSRASVFPVQHHALGAEAAVDDVDFQIKAVVERGKQCLVAQMRVSHKNKLCIWGVSAV